MRNRLARTPCILLQCFTLIVSEARCSLHTHEAHQEGRRLHPIPVSIHLSLYVFYVSDRLRFVQAVGSSPDSILLLAGSRAETLGSVGQSYLQKLWEQAREVTSGESDVTCVDMCGFGLSCYGVVSTQDGETIPVPVYPAQSARCTAGQGTVAPATR